MKYKFWKVISVVLLASVLVIAFASCTETPNGPQTGDCKYHIDAGSDGECDVCGKLLPICRQHLDANTDTFCDDCGQKLDENDCNGNHTDGDNDGVCDKCGEEYTKYCTVGHHVDLNHDGVCDIAVCGKSGIAITHTDENEDDICDGCGASLGSSACTDHIDTNNDGLCDICTNTFSKDCIGQHTDANHDGTCDLLICLTTGLSVVHDEVSDDNNCSTAVVCSCGYTITAAKSHDFTGDYEADASGHWHICGNEGCTVTDTKAAHSGTDDSNCTTAVVCLCGYTITSAKSHDFTGNYEADASGHWHICGSEGCTVTDTKVSHSGTDDNNCSTAVVCSCGYTITSAKSHDFTRDYETDASGHWHICGNEGCTVTDTKAAHSGTDDSNCSTAVVCSCGYIITSAKSHDFTGDYETDASGHWHICKNEGCTVTDTKAAHSGTDDSNCTTAVVCLCGYTITAAKSHDFTGDYEADASGHWHICENEGCTVTDTKAAHSGTDDSNCTTAVVCSCGYTITSAKSHDFTGDYETDASGHWHICENEGCTVTEIKALHIDSNNDGKCDVCTVTFVRVCEGAHTDADHDGTCDLVICLTTGLTVIHDDISDDNNCSTAVVCSCGYTVTSAKSHDFTGDYEADENGHWHICENEGCTVTDTKASHSGTDDNNCSTAVVCSCGYTVTAAKSHDFTGDYEADVNGHWHICENEGCTVTDTKASHSGTDDNNCSTAVVCSCGYTVTSAKSHDFTGDYEADVNGHWHVCENEGCTVTDTKAAHSGTDDNNCSTAVVCSCGYTVTSAKSHDFTGAWTKNSTEHWHICINDGCTVTDVKARHADADDDGYCDACNYKIEIHIHIDDNDDGTCDSCSVSIIIDVDLYALNDMHGKFLASDVQPGVGGLTTYLSDAKDTNPNTVIFASGDMWQGSAESGLSKGKIINDWMKEVGFAFMTIGNHEFDWSGEYILSNTSSELPFLGINIYDKTTGERVEYAEPSVMVDLGDVQIGFIGAIGDCLSSISGEFTGNLEFKLGKELTALIIAESDRLRASGADIIVLSIHSGSSGAISSDYDTALSDGYVDIVFEAHSHSSYALQDEYGVWHLQAGGDNTVGMYNVDVDYNSVTGSFSVTPELISKSTYGAYDEHESIETIKELNRDAIDKTTTVIGTNSQLRDSNFLRTLMAQLYLEAGLEKWGSEYDIVLGGGYLSCRSPGRLDIGDITYGDLYMLFPFDNVLALCTVSGSKLDTNIINSTNSNYFICLTEYGSTVSGSIDPDATYYIITDSYNYSHAMNKFPVVSTYVDYETVFTYARDLLAEYISEGGLETVTVELKPDDYNSVTDINAYGASMPDNTVTADKYFTVGIIKEIKNETWGNMYIDDGAGNMLYIYGLYTVDGIRYDAMENKPKVGDHIYVYGSIERSGSTVRIKDAVYAEYRAGGQYYTIEELLAYGSTLVANQTTLTDFGVVGTVDSIVNEIYGNLYIKDELGNLLYVYGVYDNRGNRYDSMSDKPKVGDKIYICGALKKFVNSANEVKIEIVNAGYARYLEGDQYYTASELEEHGLQLLDGQTTSAKFYIKGEVTILSDTEYGHFYIKDANGDLIYVYGLKDSDGNFYGSMEAKPKEGDTVTIYGVIKRYINGSGVATVEFYHATCVDIIPKCTSHTDENNDGLCDTCEQAFIAACEGTHTDADHDGICDIKVCGISGLAVHHTDANTDGICDDCNKKYVTDISVILGLELQNNESTTEYYYILATLDTTPNAAIGSVDVTDETGTLYIYTISGFTTLEGKPDKYDRVLLYGIIKNYNGTIEMVDAMLVSYIAIDPPEHECEDADSDNYCDICEQIIDAAVCMVHVDANMDGACDSCSETYTVTSNADINTACASLASGEYSTEYYYVKGYISRITDAAMGKLYIVDDTDTLYVFKVFDLTGAVQYGSLEGKPDLYDEIVVYGRLQNYNGTYEIVDTRLVGYSSLDACPAHVDHNTDNKCDICSVIIDEALCPPHTDENFDGVCEKCEQTYVTSASEILALGLSTGEQTSESYYIVGTLSNLTSTSYGNGTFTDSTGSLTIYGMYDAEGNRYSAMANKPAVGDTVILYGVIKNHNGNIQIINAVVIAYETASV